MGYGRQLRTAIVLLSSMALLCGLTACGLRGNSASPTSTSSAPQSAGLDVQLIGSDFAIGQNRFTFTLTENNAPLTSAQPEVYFFSLHGFSALPAGHSSARFRPVGSAQVQSATGFAGSYVTHTTFDRAGKWGAEIDFVAGGKKRSLQSIFDVSKHSITPSVGEAAPRSNNPTVSQVALSKLDSGQPPDDMHTVSIASAIARHRPLVLLFASSAYCGAFHCRSEIAVVQSLERRYGRGVDFVHVDVFQNARPPHVATTAVQWGVRSQPWVFVVNRNGRVSAKFEGPTSAGEILAALPRGSR